VQRNRGLEAGYMGPSLMQACVDLKRYVSNHCLENISADTYMNDFVKGFASDHERLYISRA
jgi:hypothetical protein